MAVKAESQLPKNALYPLQKELSLPNNHSLTPEYASNLFFFSYEHAQGRPYTIQLIFSALHVFRPDWKMDDALKASVSEIVTPKIERYLSHSQNIIGENNEDTLVNDSSRVIYHGTFKKKDMATDINHGIYQNGGLDGMQRALNSENVPDINHLVEDMTACMIEDDAEYLSLPNGRPRKNLDPRTPKGDPWFSYLCHYGLNSNSTGFPELDQIYQMMKQGIMSSEFFRNADRKIDAAFTFVVEAYNICHPDSKVVL